MLQFTAVEDLRAYRAELRRRNRRLALVPTMGALHRGHLSLVELARTRADRVIATIFVNPTQFGPNEDFERYPRDLDRDVEALRSAGCDALYAPAAATMYPPGFQTTVRVPGLSDALCGARRPGHFDGVATVVTKLLLQSRPDVAVFGEKDFQQLAIIRRLVVDLSLDVEIVGGPIVRDVDGVALSSRNAYLDAAERARASSLSRGLIAARALFERGERRGERLVEAVAASLTAAALQPEYIELRSFLDLEPLDEADGPCVLLTAVRVGTTRLIDNVVLVRP